MLPKIFTSTPWATQLASARTLAASPTYGPDRVLCAACLLRKILLIARDEFGDIGADDIEFAADLLLLTGFQAADPEVAVNAGDDSWEDFLVRFPGDGHDHLLVRRKTAAQTVAGDESAERPRVDVIAIHSFRAIHLARGVAGLVGPRFGRHAG